MNQRIGINLSKRIDSLNKRIKVPAVTQRDYYLSNDDVDDDVIDFYKVTSIKNSNDEDVSKYNYLMEDEEEDNCTDQCDCCDEDYDEEECYCGDNCCCNMLEHIKPKNMLLVGAGVVLGCMAIRFIRKRM